MHHLEYEDGNIEVKQFSFFNYLDERRNFPDDIQLKSMFDLSASIISYLKTAPNYNWIICEGGDDKIYLDTVLPKGKYRILPVGGCGNVKKLYSLLLGPLNIERADQKLIQNRVLCLIDTDERKTNFNGEIFKSFPIQIRRLQVCKNKGDYDLELVNPYSDGQLYGRTEIEDCLNPEIYYNAVKNVVNKYGEEETRNMFNKFEFNNQAVTSEIPGDNSILIPTDAEAYQNKYKLIEFLSKSETKYNVAVEYSLLHEDIRENDSYVTHNLVQVIENFFV